MSITDELREFAALCPGGMGGDALRHIADNIDTAHRSALEKLAAQMDESDDGWVRMPVDADGVPIHVGDVMENIVCPSVHREATGVGVECFYGWDEDNARYSQFDAVRYRHHHAPTVEDVLDEFFGKANLPDGTQTRSEIIAEFAAKLRLANSGE